MKMKTLRITMQIRSELFNSQRWNCTFSSWLHQTAQVQWGLPKWVCSKIVDLSCSYVTAETTFVDCLSSRSCVAVTVWIPTLGSHCGHTQCDITFARTNSNLTTIIKWFRRRAHHKQFPTELSDVSHFDRDNKCSTNAPWRGTTY